MQRLFYLYIARHVNKHAILSQGGGQSPEFAFIRLDNLPQRFSKLIGSFTGCAFKIAEDHDGGIDVESEVGKGSTFTLRLPVREDESPEETNERG